MKKSIKKYSVVQFYPDFSINEFINIGIIVYDDVALKIRMLESDEIKHINCSYFTDKKTIENTSNYLYDEFSKLNDKQSFFQLSKSLYYDNFSFSKERSFISEDPLKVEVDLLFYRYIGKKLEKEEYIPKKEAKKKEIINLIDNKYSRKLSFEEDEFFDLLLVPNKGEPYPTIIGSLLNDADTSNAFRAHINRPSKNALFAYLNTNDEIVKNKIKAENVRDTLHKQMHMKLIDFSSSDKIEKSLDKILEDV